MGLLTRKQKLMQATDGTEYFVSQAGIAKPIPAVVNGEAPGSHGRIAPTGASVIVLPGRKADEPSRRLVIYPASSPTPYPLGSDKEIQAPNFKEADLRILQGPYLAALLARALKLIDENAKWRIQDIVIMILLGINTILSGIALGVVVKFAKDAGFL